MAQIEWTIPLEEALAALVKQGISFARIASTLSARFNLEISRCACIGKARRIGATLPERPKRQPVEHKRSPRVPKTRSGEHHAIFKVIAANGNSNHLKVMESRATEMPRLRCVEIEPLHISLIDLESHHCRYVYGGDGAPFTFCGHDVQADSSWCQTHHKLCHERKLTLSEHERERRRNHARRMRAQICYTRDAAEAI